MRFQYGEAGDLFKVNTGDVWRVGGHTLLCGDLEQGAATQLLGITGDPDVCYTDPPWNPGIARSFRTQAGVDGLNGRPVDFTGGLLPAILQAASRTRGPVAIEPGKQYVDRMEELVAQHGGTVHRRDAITYYGKRPCTLSICTFHGATPTIPVMDGESDERTPFLFLEAAAQPGALVFDPCMGQGLTAKAAHSLGMRSCGVELHPRRLACTIKLLVDAGAGDVECLRP